MAASPTCEKRKAMTRFPQLTTACRRRRRASSAAVLLVVQLTDPTTPGCPTYSHRQHTVCLHTRVVWTSPERTHTSAVRTRHKSHILRASNKLLFKPLYQLGPNWYKRSAAKVWCYNFVTPLSQIFHRTTCRWKNFENRPFGENMDKNLRLTFWSGPVWIHCVNRNWTNRSTL